MNTVLETLTFPPSFCLPDVAAITEPVLPFRKCPYTDAACNAVRPWYEEFSRQYAFLFRLFNFISFDDLAYYVGTLYPDATRERLEAVLRYNILAFFCDDMLDAGPFLGNSSAVTSQVVELMSNSIIFKPDAQRPTEPLPAAIHDLYCALQKTSRPGTFRRLTEGGVLWLDSVLKQVQKCDQDIPTPEEFLVRRRAMAAGYLSWAIIEYAADVDIPDAIFSHPAVTAVLDNLIDIVTIQNDICSFNKEQAAGDGNNLVVAIMAKRKVDLQTAVDIATGILKETVEKYVKLKASIPSFGKEYDAHLAKYLDAIGCSTQALAIWYYKSPRYTHDLDLSKRGEMIVPVFPRSDMSALNL